MLIIAYNQQSGIILLALRKDAEKKKILGVSGLRGRMVYILNEQLNSKPFRQICKLLKGEKMANDPNYSREELFRIVESWNEAQYFLDDHADKEYTLYRKDINELGLIPALIWLDTEIVFEKDSERDGLESFVDEYGTTWVRLDKEWFLNRFDFLGEKEILDSLYTLVGKVLWVGSEGNPSSYGFYAKYSDYTRGLAFKELCESNDIEGSWRTVMKKYYPEVYADMEDGE